MTRRGKPPSHRPPGSARPSKDRDTIDSELRAARASRRADSQQKHALRRREWDDEIPETEAEDEEMFDEVSEDEASSEPEEEPEESPKKKRGRS
jgi:hypothetical protein